MGKGSKYVSKKPDENGFIAYTSEEDAIWKDLFERQEEILPNLVCKDLDQALHDIKLPRDRIPQLPDVTKTLENFTGWGVEGVPALISPQKFFDLLANKRFPAATFIRTREEFDYLQEPDVFHEIFGHCPLLTNQVYADFMQKYGEISRGLDSKFKWYLLRLYWFTVEFGLIKEEDDTKIYGAGIISSHGESPYALESNEPERRPFDLVQVLRTPYRIDIFQTVYYVIESFDQLYELVSKDLVSAVKEAEKLGPLEPTFPPKEATA
jgi:phenylalanine-4-hydroxylase